MTDATNPARMQPLLERRVLEVILPAVPELVVAFAGEPGAFALPVALYPLGIVYTSDAIRATGQEGYGGELGISHWLYRGYFTLEHVQRDLEGMAPPTSVVLPSDKIRQIASYDEVTDMNGRGLAAIYEWIGIDGTAVEDDPVISEDDKERTIRFIIDRVSNGQQNRGDSWTNRAGFFFTIVTAKVEA